MLRLLVKAFPTPEISPIFYSSMFNTFFFIFNSGELNIYLGIEYEAEIKFSFFLISVFWQLAIISVSSDYYVH